MFVVCSWRCSWEEEDDVEGTSENNSDAGEGGHLVEWSVAVDGEVLVLGCIPEGGGVNEHDDLGNEEGDWDTEGDGSEEDGENGSESEENGADEGWDDVDGEVAPGKKVPSDGVVWVDAIVVVDGENWSSQGVSEDNWHESLSEVEDDEEVHEGGGVGTNHWVLLTNVLFNSICAEILENVNDRKTHS